MIFNDFSLFPIAFKRISETKRNQLMQGKTDTTRKSVLAQQ